MIVPPTDKGDYVELSNGLIVPEHVARELVRPRAVDLFSGAGGMSLGMIQGGFDVVAAVDSDPICALTYLTNLGAYPMQFHWIEPKDEARMEKAIEKELFRQNKKKRIVEAMTSGSNRDNISELHGFTGVGHFFLGDIRKLPGAKILDAIGLKRGELECVAGSPPCQGFSTSGKRDVMDPRNSLVFEFCRLVIELHPKTMIFENVPGIMSMVTPDGIPVLDAMTRILEDGGFGTMNALKRSIANQLGIALVRGKKRSSPKEQEEETEADEPAQLSLTFKARRKSR
jgi:DNA (cytosine-5)-methyltransferase 1